MVSDESQLHLGQVTLSDVELDRYARHIVLRQVGGAGQLKLKAGRVLVIGAGGIGSPAIQYLAAAGVGWLGVVDDDTVALSNLQRQTLYGTADIGEPKVAAAAVQVARLNPHVTLDAIPQRIDAATAHSLFRALAPDVILDGCDNFATRLAVSDATVRARVPLVSAALGMFQGQIGTFRGWEAEQSCYRCFVGDAFDADDCDTCAEDGVLGAMAGWAGTFAALQAIRVLLSETGGMGDALWGKLHVLDGLAPSLRTMRIAKDPQCRACGQSTAQGQPSHDL